MLGVCINSNSTILIGLDVSIVVCHFPSIASLKRVLSYGICVSRANVIAVRNSWIDLDHSTVGPDSLGPPLLSPCPWRGRGKPKLFLRPLVALLLTLVLLTNGRMAPGPSPRFRYQLT